MHRLDMPRLIMPRLNSLVPAAFLAATVAGLSPAAAAPLPALTAAQVGGPADALTQVGWYGRGYGHGGYGRAYGYGRGYGYAGYGRGYGRGYGGGLAGAAIAGTALGLIGGGLAAAAAPSYYGGYGGYGYGGGYYDAGYAGYSYPSYGYPSYGYGYGCGC
ncbi:hypothetical protein [Methylobacterium sp. A54F]